MNFLPAVFGLGSKGKIRLAMEIKLSNQPQLSKGSTLALQDLGNPPLLVVTPTSESYTLKRGVQVCSVANLPDKLKALLG